MHTSPILKINLLNISSWLISPAMSRTFNLDGKEIPIPDELSMYFNSVTEEDLSYLDEETLYESAKKSCPDLVTMTVFTRKYLMPYLDAQNEFNEDDDDFIADTDEEEDD